MKDPLKMLRQAQQLQSRMEKLQKELENETVEASAGGGAVTVVVTGGQKIVSVRIDPEATGDAEMLQDLVVAAVNEALERSKRMASEKVSALTAGLGLPPGLI
ncbi:MAG TPA: YbaB/EbfC family nucleoid-associated protein [Candidatus Dormibacteraeota bacterium]|nr:YbaB/EbfC family nucleoid-associated protein [Candidatus Dormibacteraeota bacterium]